MPKQELLLTTTSSAAVFDTNNNSFQIEAEKQAGELILSAVKDVIEQKEKDEYIAHLASIVESSHDAIISKTLDGIIKSWNKGGEQMFGFTAEEAIGKHISLIIPKNYEAQEKTILERIRNNEVLDHFETVRIKKNGEQLFVSLTVSPLKDKNGIIIGVSKIARDISFRKISEEELILANKELAFQIEEKEKRAAELIIANFELAFQNEEKEKRAAELMVANKELEQLTYIASHDLQEPLRTISNYMAVFEEDYLERLDEVALNYIRSVNNATKRMSIRVHALLDFSRLGRDKRLINVDCNKLIQNVIEDLQMMITDSNAIIEVLEMPTLNIYEVEIGQLFQNLIVNAIKFRKKDVRPQIKICSKKVNQKWLFTVSDNGIGIASVHFQKIFNIFQRLHLNNEYEGNGIGLANCKKIVELHHGEIWIESTIGKGTKLKFTIPILSL